jgi:hypothetical protein
MKKLLFLLFSIFTLSISAQAPQAFNYQGVARDNKGVALANQNISLRMSILSGSASGTAEYVETHSVTTDAYGLFTLAVGGGKVVSGNFSQITWSSNTKFLKVEMDANGGTNYVFMGTSQLLSVPYALYAEKSGSTDNVDDADADPKNEIQTLSRTGNKLSLSNNGGDITLPDSNYWRKNGDTVYYDKGFVGIGTKSPKSLLHIKSQYGNLVAGGYTMAMWSENAAFGAGIYLRGGNATSEWAWAATPNAAPGAGSNQFELHRIEGSTTNFPFVVTNDEKIGIGTRSPIDKLHVKGQLGDFIVSGYSASLTSTSTGYGGALYLKGGSSTYSWGLVSNPKNGLSGEDQFQIQRIGSGVSSPLVITNNDYVGIGTTNPTDKLHVKTQYGDLITNGYVISLASNNAGYGAGIYMKGGSATSTWGWSANPNAGGSIPGNDQFQLQRFQGSGNTTPIVVTNNDQVGIGTLTPTSKLDVAGRGIFRSEYYTVPGGLGTYVRIGFDSTNNWGYLAADNPKTGWQIMTIEGKDVWINSGGGGNVGIGTKTPSQKLSVSGNICYTGSIGACSDIRYKKDIVPIENSLDKVMRMNGVYYNWKTKEFPEQNFSDKHQLGFIAQDIEKLFPELVMTDDKGYKSVDYSKVTPVLVEALKEQQRIIDKQQQKLDKLEAKVEALMKEDTRSER